MAVFDLILGLLLVVLVRKSLNVTDLFGAVISFMAFGLLMAVAWVRLEAPDIALAEAAIGSGLTGVLLFSTLGRLPHSESKQPILSRAVRSGPGYWMATGFWWLSAMLLLALFVLSFQDLQAPGLGKVIQERIAESGVSNPVTAVLLNFRSLDTVMEVAVLLLAVVVVWSMGTVGVQTKQKLPSPLLPGLVRLLTPAFVLVALSLLWRGSHAPGGAFPGGAILAAAGILLLLTGMTIRISPGAMSWLRWILAGGLLVFVLAGMSLMIAGFGFLEYPEPWAGTIIFLIEASAGVSIGAMLMALYIGGEPDIHPAQPTSR
ncbi:hydrogenase subunit MbhD domain-containing protein [Desulfonatronum parangueonense]